jgi:DNA mismatch endonuclease (patch repair protein)
MRRIRRTDTLPEVRLRSILHQMGFRFRKDVLLRLDGRSVRPDIVFPRYRVAIFIDGCFWHGCPEHGHVPKSNKDYWKPKLQRNQIRDELADRALAAANWTSIRLWEHTPLEEAAQRIAMKLRNREGGG